MREKNYIKQQYQTVLYYIGIILLLSTILMFFPLLVLFSYPQEIENIYGFIMAATLQGFFGWILYRLFNPINSSLLTAQEGGVIILISWCLVMLFSALPFIFIQGLSFSRALFESVSGWTTTGLSMIDVSLASKMILLWRSIIQLAGGAGLAIIMISAIVEQVGVGISTAEGHNDQLVPQVRQSARLVLTIYICYAFVGILAYFLAGMSFFDSINHSFAAISTGGFSTRVESIGYWDSVAIESITIALMLLGNLSFVTAWLLWRGKIRLVLRNIEVRLCLIVIPLATAILFIFVCYELYSNVGKSLRVSLFETISALTTTGFSTVSYTNWNSLGIFLLILLMLIGGGTCSTSGAIKQFRIYLLLNSILWEFKRALLPRTAVIEHSIWEGEQQVFIDNDRIRQIYFFVFIYLITYAIGTLILCASGYSLQDSLFEFASALGTVGLSIGVTSASMPDLALWAETVAMFLGRLEFMVIIVSIFKLGQDSSCLLFNKNF